MTELEPLLSQVPPLSGERSERIARLARERLAGEEPRAHPVERALVATFSIATLVWAVVVVVP